MKHLKILLVEDEKETSLLIESFLKKKFNNIEVAFDGEEALLKYKSFMPDIMLTDINMPKLNGINLAKEIRKNDLDTRIIMLTAYNEQENLSQAVKLNLDDFLLKPIDLSKLKDALETASINYEKKILFLVDDFYWNCKEEILFNKNNESITLSKNEKLLLSLLCKNKNLYFSKYEISEYLYGTCDKLNNIRTLISRLKSKTSSNIIESVFDEGYRIKQR